MKSKKICLNCIYDENIPNISFSEMEFVTIVIKLSF